MILTGLCRVGRDAELRYMPDGTAVANVSLAFNHGKKGQDGNRPSQWIDAAIFGKRAESVAKYLTKGTAIDVVIEGPHIEEFKRRDGTTGTKLVGSIAFIDFAGGGGSIERQAPSAPSAPAPRQAQVPKGSGFEDFEDDIPF